MPAPAPTSRHLSVRLDPAVRTRLDDLATSSDRTLAQLIRYAVTDLLAAPDKVAALHAGDTFEAAGTRHATVRLPAELADAVDALAARAQATTSDVLRTAVDRWLTRTDPQHLGAPTVGGPR